MNDSATATAVDATRFASAHQRLLGDPTVQFDLPQYFPPQLPEWVQTLFALLGRSWPVFRIVLLAAAAAAVVAVAIAVWRRIAARTTLTAADDEPAWRPAEVPARALLADADALAAAGDYAAAAHLVLLRSIEQIGERRPGVVAPALTSRDIARLATLPGDVARAFAEIGRVVETGVFAARPVEAAAWERCRAAYAAVAFSSAWA